MDQTFRLRIVTPYREVVTEDVGEAQVPGQAGYLGILPGHAPLISELKVGEITYRRGGEAQYLAVSGGFLEVLPDQVTILAGVRYREGLVPRMALPCLVAHLRVVMDSARLSAVSNAGRASGGNGVVVV